MRDQNDAEATILRDNAWLNGRMTLLWEVHFSDVARGFPIVTRFGMRAQRRFGSIAARNGTTVILINQLFADPFVPEYVVDGTLAHELAHYAHGFGSGLPRLHADPHRGGVVDKELEARGLGDVDRKADIWRETYWDDYYQSRCADIVSRKRSMADASTNLWTALLFRPDARTVADLRQLLWRLAPQLGYSAKDNLPFSVEWLHANRRQSGTSYWFARTRVVRLHGLLADGRITDRIVEFEVAYWLARCRVGTQWPNIRAALCAAGLERVVEEAIHWRRKSWTAFRNRNHPLR